MDFLIQLFQLNYKTVIQLIKIYASAVLTVHWKNINFSFSDLVSTSNLKFGIYCLFVFLAFHFLMSFIIGMINLKIARALVYKIEKKGVADDYTDEVIKRGNIIEGKMQDAKGVMMWTMNKNTGLIHQLLFDSSIIILQIMLIKFNWFSLITSLTFLLITPVFMAGVSIINHNESNRNKQ